MPEQDQVGPTVLEQPCESSEVVERYAHIPLVSENDQARKVYDWEDRTFPDSLGGCYLSLDQCQKYVESIWGDLKLPGDVPKVLDGRGSRSARSWGDRIMLPRWSRNYSVLTHELAHCIAELIDSEDNHEHGGVFTHIYFLLMARYCGHKYQELVESAQNSGIRVKPVKLAHRIEAMKAVDK